MLETTPEDFAALVELNLLGLVHARAAAPHLLATKGHLVNIGSLAGKSATRFMGAYPASKFAVSAYSQQLRLELEPEGLHVLLVCPGPIVRETLRGRQRTSPRGRGRYSERPRKPGAGAKVKLLRPDVLAEKIVHACESRQPELVLPGKARLRLPSRRIATLGRLAGAEDDRVAALAYSTIVDTCPCRSTLGRTLGW